MKTTKIVANTLLKKYLDIKQPTESDKQLLVEAEASFRRSYSINLNFIYAAYNIGFCNVQLRNGPEALKWLQRALEIEPRHGLSHEQLVRVYGELLNQPQNAMKHMDFVLQTAEGQTAYNYHHLGILQAMQGSFEESEKSFLKSIELAPFIVLYKMLNS